MKTQGILAMAALPLLVAACAREPEPEVVVLAGPELACAEQAAIASGLDASVVTGIGRGWTEASTPDGSTISG